MKSVTTAQQLKPGMETPVSSPTHQESRTKISLGCFSELMTYDSDLKLSSSSLNDSSEILKCVLGFQIN